MSVYSTFLNVRLLLSESKWYQHQIYVTTSNDINKSFINHLSCEAFVLQIKVINSIHFTAHILGIQGEKLSATLVIRAGGKW